jgi:methylated-DNA-protein-cysteine methyltransferase-like protein
MTGSESRISPLYRQIYALVAQVPSGYVTTYGRLAQLIGCTPRTVGFALAALPKGNSIPWQRVVNSQGRVSPRSDGDGSRLQRDLLEAEGVTFNLHQRIDLTAFFWSFPDS